MWHIMEIKELLHLKYPCDWFLAIKLPHINLRNVVGLQTKVGVSAFLIHLPCDLIMNFMECIFTFRCLLYYENFQYFHDRPFKPSILVSNLASIESILFCSSFMSLHISSPSSRVQVGFYGGLFGVEVPFLGGMLAKYHF
jgi:hypothetical protein